MSEKQQDSTTVLLDSIIVYTRFVNAFLPTYPDDYETMLNEVESLYFSSCSWLGVEEVEDHREKIAEILTREHHAEMLTKKGFVLTNLRKESKATRDFFKRIHPKQPKAI